MNLYDFTFGGIPQGYGWRTQRAAVLYPLMGMGHGSSQLLQKISALQRRWRACTVALVKAGWRPQGQSAGIVRVCNCRPAFVLVMPQAWACGQVGICPFCYARRVAEIWQQIDGAYAKFARVREADPGSRRSRAVMWLSEEEVAAKQPPYCLVERVFSQYVRLAADDFDPAPLRRLLQDIAKARGKRMRKIQALGAFAMTTVVPAKTDIWQVRQRELYKVRVDYDFAGVGMSGPGCQVRRHEAVSRNVLYQAVARTCRYPVQLLRQPPARVLQLLQAQRGEAGDDRPPRLAAFYGTWRT